MLSSLGLFYTETSYAGRGLQGTADADEMFAGAEEEGVAGDGGVASSSESYECRVQNENSWTADANQVFACPEIKCVA